MGIYTDTILRRYNADHKAAADAEASLYRVLESFHKSVVADNDLECVLRVILTKWGLDFRMPSGDVSPERLFDSVLEPLGILYEFVDLPAHWNHRNSDCMVGFTKDGQAVALMPEAVGYRCYFSDGSRRIVHGGDDFLESTAICIYRPFSESENVIKGFVKYIFKLITPREVLPIVVSALLIALLGLIVPSAYKIVLNGIIPLGQDGVHQLGVFGIVFIMTGIVSALIKVIRQLLLNQLSLSISNQAQTAVMAKVLLLPDKFFKTQTAGRLSSRINASKRMTSILISVAIDTSFTALFSLVYIPQMFRYAYPLALPALGILLISAVTSLLIGVWEFKKERLSISASMECDNFLYATLRGIQKIKNAGAEDRAYAKWANLYCDKLKETHNPSSFLMIDDVILNAITSAGTILFLAIAGHSGDVSASAYISFTAAYSMISAGITQFVNIANSLMLIRPLAEQMQPIFSTELEQTEALTSVTRLRGDVEVRDITFRYEDDGPNVLDGISFKIKRGESVAFVGESGCGKSTLLQILLGFEKPLTGTVFYDNAMFDTLDARSLRKHLGVVLQSSKIIPGTIYSNIAFNSPWMTEQDVMAALDKAQVGQFVSELPQGVDTELSQFSGGISGGQKQCILLARALANNPSVIILDEATSAMDNLTQSKALEALGNIHATKIMVAHRLSTVVDCDHIFVMQDGRITEDGTYEELIAKNGFFAELVARQQLNS